mmetsp:Transcript_4151/g.9638  ORF Transcript_4151/g.9638 Transcript_4151/m.9638 type:complete len:207 (-) Transcript_4151:14-634(-)
MYTVAAAARAAAALVVAHAAVAPMHPHRSSQWPELWYLVLCSGEWRSKNSCSCSPSCQEGTLQWPRSGCQAARARTQVGQPPPLTKGCCECLAGDGATSALDIVFQCAHSILLLPLCLNVVRSCSSALLHECSQAFSDFHPHGLTTSPVSCSWLAASGAVCTRLPALALSKPGASVLCQGKAVMRLNRESSRIHQKSQDRNSNFAR